jgi:Ni/Co efflux regulator RcnB
MTNRYLAILLAIFVGPSALFARSPIAPPAQRGNVALTAWHGQDRGDDARRGNKQRKWRSDDERRGRDDRYNFRDRDRQAVREWYEHHRGHEPEGFRRRDWLAPKYESRLRVGFVLGPDMRRMAYPVPDDLLYQLPPCPRHYRYVAIGGHICLVDRGYRVHDLIHLEINFR